jgi:DNA-directed RNA polymerase subunit M/transcription elongation factor TFIIS
MRRDQALQLLHEVLEKGFKQFSIKDVLETTENPFIAETFETLVFQQYDLVHQRRQSEPCAKSAALQAHCEDTMFYCDLIVDLYSKLDGWLTKEENSTISIDKTLVSWNNRIVELLEEFSPIKICLPFKVNSSAVAEQQNSAIQAEEDALSNLTLDNALERMDGKEKWKIMAQIICGVCGDKRAHQMAKQDRSIDEGMSTWVVCQNKQCKARYPI